MGVEEILCIVYCSSWSPVERELFLSFVAATLFGLIPLALVMWFSDDENLREEGEGDGGRDSYRGETRSSGNRQESRSQSVQDRRVNSGNESRGGRSRHNNRDDLGSVKSREDSASPPLIEKDERSHHEEIITTQSRPASRSSKKRTQSPSSPGQSLKSSRASLNHDRGRPSMKSYRETEIESILKPRRSVSSPSNSDSTSQPRPNLGEAGSKESQEPSRFSATGPSTSKFSSKLKNGSSTPSSTSSDQPIHHKNVNFSEEVLYSIAGQDAGNSNENWSIEKSEMDSSESIIYSVSGSEMKASPHYNNRRDVRVWSKISNQDDGNVNAAVRLTVSEDNQKYSGEGTEDHWKNIGVVGNGSEGVSNRARTVDNNGSSSNYESVETIITEERDLSNNSDNGSDKKSKSSTPSNSQQSPGQDYYVKETIRKVTETLVEETFDDDIDDEIEENLSEESNSQSSKKSVENGGNGKESIMKQKPKARPTNSKVNFKGKELSLDVCPNKQGQCGESTVCCPGSDCCFKLKVELVRPGDASGQRVTDESNTSLHRSESNLRIGESARSLPNSASKPALTSHHPQNGRNDSSNTNVMRQVSSMLAHTGSKAVLHDFKHDNRARDVITSPSIGHQTTQTTGEQSMSDRHVRQEPYHSQPASSRYISHATSNYKQSQNSGNNDKKSEYPNYRSQIASPRSQSPEYPNHRSHIPSPCSQSPINAGYNDKQVDYKSSISQIRAQSQPSKSYVDRLSHRNELEQQGPGRYQSEDKIRGSLTRHGPDTSHASASYNGQNQEANKTASRYSQNQTAGRGSFDNVSPTNHENGVAACSCACSFPPKRSGALGARTSFNMACVDMPPPPSSSNTAHNGNTTACCCVTETPKNKKRSKKKSKKSKKSKSRSGCGPDYSGSSILICTCEVNDKKKSKRRDSSTRCESSSSSDCCAESSGSDCSCSSCDEFNSRKRKNKKKGKPCMCISCTLSGFN